MPVYTGTMDGETIGSYPELADNERIVNTEIFYHYSGISNPFEPNPFAYNMFRITTEYFTPGQRKDASYYHGALAGDHHDVTEGAPMGHRMNIPTSMSPSAFAQLLSSTKSRVGGSLPSKPKTRGKHSYVPSASRYLAYYEGGKGKHEDSICRKGYRYVAKSGTLGMCVRK